MVKLNKIYTRTGDEGMTGLVDGSRVPKNHPRVVAFGAVDEANSAIGLARLHLSGTHDAMLGRIQNDLFDLGADLATPMPIDGALRICAAQVARLEAEIDAMNAALQPLTSFILPGGSTASAFLHMARAIMRRAEQCMVEASQSMDLNPDALRYANRLSDHLFVMARVCNNHGQEDVLWVPGQNR